MSRAESDNEDVVLYEAQKILQCKEVDGKKYYLIKWKNWPDDFNSWESEESVKKIQPLLDQYLSKSSTEPSKS